MSNEKEDSPIVLVTGSGRGLGRGIAVELAKNGFSVAIHYGSSSQGAQETIALCEEVKQNESQLFECFQADLSDEVSRKSLIPSIIKKLGFIDSLINNAGITEPNRRDCLEATEEDYDTVMNINLKALLELRSSQFNDPGKAPNPPLPNHQYIINFLRYSIH